MLVILLAVACGGGGPAYQDVLAPCRHDDGPVGAYCGTVHVFEDRAAGSGRRIPLAVVVLPAAGDETRTDPLFFLAGGPGQGAARLAPQIAAAFAPVLRHRDIVLVDQRGTGRSGALDCSRDDQTLAAMFAADAVLLERLRRCLAGLRADVRHYTTPPAMDDLDEVRRHLGFQHINLYGASYGTRAALVYLRRHGAHVRSVVLDGAVPTNMQLPLFTARDAEGALERVLAACDADAACAAAYPQLSSRVRALVSRLDRRPAPARLVHPRTGTAEDVEVTARAVASIIFGGLYSPVTASLLPLLLDRADAGDFQGLVALAFAGDSSENLSVGMQLSVLCSEDAQHVSADDVRAENAGRLFGMHLAAGPLEACRIWPRAPMDPSYYAAVSSDVPALVLSGALDPVTPPSWGDAVSHHLPRSRHVIAAASGHGVAASACGVRLVARFLEAGAADALDTACLDGAVRPPFFLTPSGPNPLPADPSRSAVHTPVRPAAAPR